MNITAVIIAAVIVGGTGLFIGVFLGLAGKKFAVEVDEREEAILGVLPGNNCGGCGYAGWCKIPLAEIVAFLTAIGKATADNKSGLLLPKHQLKYNSSPLLRQ